LLYLFTKYLVRAGLFFFCKKIVFSDTKTLGRQGPLLLACNHPNSFFDAVLLGAYFDKPVHYLARGDAFRNPWAVKILTALKAIPIYRLREGKEYLALNDATFEKCSEILKLGGIVLIFTEGLCLHQWKLQPLKKGTARIALNVWKDENMQQNFTILPVSLNYSTFKSFNKNVLVHFGKPISYNQISSEVSEAEQMLDLNKHIETQLEQGMLTEVNDDASIRFLLSNLSNKKNNQASLISLLQNRLLKMRSQALETAVVKLNENKIFPSGSFGIGLNIIAALVLFIPAIVGFMLNLPLYLPLKYFLKKKTAGTVFYHSSLFVALIIIYPIYAALLSLFLSSIMPQFSFLIWMTGILTSALCARVFFDHLTAVTNYFVLPAIERKKLSEINR
jgi:1-acyl-sn-glycerol-3-phosphate acyltransferase